MSDDLENIDTYDFDLGSGYFGRFIGWWPDRNLNPQYDGIPDVEKYGLIVTCPHGDGMITLDGPVQQKVSANQPRWTVESWDPLTLSPSILRHECGCHGYIRDSKWVPA